MTRKTTKNAYNSSRLTKNSYFEIGDFVLVRNYKRRSKFDPYFLPEKFCVVDISANGNILLIENTTNGFCLQRHPNDIKLFNGSLPLQKQGNKNDCVDNSENSQWSNAFDFIARNEYSDNDESAQQTISKQTSLRRSAQLRKPNPKYFNNDFRT